MLSYRNLANINKKSLIVSSNTKPIYLAQKLIKKNFCVKKEISQL